MATKSGLSPSLTRSQSASKQGVFVALHVDPGALALANHASVMLNNTLYVHGGENAALKKANDLKSLYCAFLAHLCF